MEKGNKDCSALVQSTKNIISFCLDTVAIEKIKMIMRSDRTHRHRERVKKERTLMNKCILVF